MARGFTRAVLGAILALALAAAPAVAHDLPGLPAAAGSGDGPTSPDISAATVADALEASQASGLPAAGEGLTGAKCENGFAGPYECENVDLESFVPLPALGVGTGNDIWGWEDPESGRRFALMGTATTTGFVEVTDPQNPVVIGQLPTEGGDPWVLWRDIKVDGHYAFIVSEIGGSGLQVFDLTRLLAHEGAPEVFTADANYDEYSYAHNIAINEETDTAYVVGSNTCGGGGLHMVDISDPLAPSFAGCFSDDGYTHDAECTIYDGPDTEHAGREVCFAFNEDTVTIVDVTDRESPVMLSRTGYASAEYTHQGWLTDNQRFLLFGDELDESRGSVPNTTTYIQDVGDLDSPGTPIPYLHETKSIDHNLYIDGNRVFQSNYAAGVRILDFTSETLAAGELEEVGYFDVVPAADPTEYAGTWSNYRFDDGTVVASAIENAVSGLFVLRPTLPDPPSDPDGEDPDEDPGSAPGNSGEKRQDDGRGKAGAKKRS